MLRSLKDLENFSIAATDGPIGQVKDFYFGDAAWAIRGLVPNISSGWVGHQVSVAPRWTTGVHWSDQSVSVDLTRAAIQQAPPYDAGAELKRQHEMGRYDHHGRNG